MFSLTSVVVLCCAVLCCAKLGCVAEALAVVNKQVRVSEGARAKATSNAEEAARQADKLTHKLANMPKVGSTSPLCPPPPPKESPSPSSPGFKSQGSLR